MKSFVSSIVLALLFLCSCSSEDSKIKEALESSISVDLVQGYELQEYMVVETILDMNVKDSITQYRSKLISNEFLIQSDSTRLKPILANMEDCKKERARTFYSLRSTYDRLIRDYKKMHDDIMLKIQEKEEENKTLGSKIKKLEGVLESLTSPVVYYKVKHIYDLNGMRKEEIVTLDFNYNYISTEQ